MAPRKKAAPKKTSTEEETVDTEVSKASSKRTSDDAHGKFVGYEFGGPLGALGIMTFFPCLFYYILVCLESNDGHFIVPENIFSFASWAAFFQDVLHKAIQFGRPTPTAAALYISLLVVQIALALIMPGIKQNGLPLPHLGYKPLVYRCNAYTSLYAYIALVLTLHYFGVLHLETIVDNYGALLTVATISGFSVATYYYLTGEKYRMSGNLIYDYFMGSTLNPRIGPVDVKMFFEIRLSWVLLLSLTFGSVSKQYRNYGYVSPNLMLYTYGVWLYTNACAKGEHLIPHTWDMYYEKFGWLLSYWNMSGVPFSYCYPAIYMAMHDPKEYEYSKLTVAFLFILLTLAYGFFDAANGQKSAFKAQMSTTLIDRPFVFPPLPGGPIKDPKYIVTKSGSKILVSGLWGWARKPNYTSDWIQALIWGSSAGFNSPIPFFYPVFHLTMLLHRQARDEAKCAEKYGPDWVEYCLRVPYIFIPYVY